MLVPTLAFRIQLRFLKLSLLVVILIVAFFYLLGYCICDIKVISY